VLHPRKGWQSAIAKEMKAVQVAFRFLFPNDELLPDYQEMTVHMVFDVKLEFFERKVCFSSLDAISLNHPHT